MKLGATCCARSLAEYCTVSVSQTGRTRPVVEWTGSFSRSRGGQREFGSLLYPVGDCLIWRVKGISPELWACWNLLLAVREGTLGGRRIIGILCMGMCSRKTWVKYSSVPGIGSPFTGVWFRNLAIILRNPPVSSCLVVLARCDSLVCYFRRLSGRCYIRR